MIIEKIILKNFRNYTETEIIPDEHINLLFGENGVGKTNIIEAIHCCSLGKSHRINQDAEIIKDGSDFSSCSVVLRKNRIKYEINVVLQKNKKKKIVKIHNKPVDHLYELIRLLKCVIFSPEDLEIVKGGPGERRRFTDMMISQIDTNYFISLQKYKYILEQRNILLKNMKESKSVNQDFLNAIDEQLVNYMMVITKKRREILKKINMEACLIFEFLCDNDHDHLNIEYQTNVNEQCAEKNFEKIREMQTEDIKYGVTGFGIHRDDVIIRMNDKNMKQFSSQGQIRTAVLSMKLAQLKIIEEETKETPVLLLDDVMSELDSVHRKKLVKYIGNIQTFITSTDNMMFDGINYQSFMIENNCGIPEITGV